MPWHWKWFGCLLVVHATTCAHIYVALAGENEGVPTALQKQEIEEQKVEQKKHRDALDFSSKWVQSLLHLCTHPEEERRA
jgi:hypothetical protein